MTDRVQGLEFPRAEPRLPVVLAGFLTAAAIVAAALATDGHWSAGAFALAASLAFALVRNSPDSNELDMPLPAARDPRGRGR